MDRHQEYSPSSLVSGSVVTLVVTIPAAAQLVVGPYPKLIGGVWCQAIDLHLALNKNNIKIFIK